MNDFRRVGLLLAVLAAPAVLVMPATSWAVKIGDITHLQGTRTNKVMGFGLVLGLKGTGDGGKYAPTMRSLAKLYETFGVAAITVDELKNAKNVAIVEVEATLPENGVREGDRIDVHLASAGGAKSLAGGRLFITPLLGPNANDTRIIALAGGPVQLVDPELPTTARIAQGATIERDFIHNYIVLGRDLTIYRSRSPSRPLQWIRPDERYVTFVIREEHAEWAVANTVAQYINEDFSITAIDGDRADSRIAIAFDPMTVAVRIPRSEWANPAAFLGRVENLQLVMPLTESRVIIDRTTGTIVLKGDVEISPVAVSHKGLTITTVAADSGAEGETPRATDGNFASIDPRHKGGAKLMDLIEALNQLRVPAEDRIAIVTKIHKLGQLHAILIVEQ